MATYRKKPVVVEAVRWPTDPKPPWFSAAETRGVIRVHGGVVLEIKTAVGIFLGVPGDWIVQDAQGEIRPEKPGVFESSYEPVQ